LKIINIFHRAISRYIVLIIEGKIKNTV